MTIFTMLIASARTLDQTQVPLPPVPILLDAANALLLDGDCTDLHCYSDVHGRGTAPWTWRKHYVWISDATTSHRLFSLLSVSGTGAFTSMTELLQQHRRFGRRHHWPVQCSTRLQGIVLAELPTSRDVQKLRHVFSKAINKVNACVLLGRPALARNALRQKRGPCEVALEVMRRASALPNRSAVVRELRYSWIRSFVTDLDLYVADSPQPQRLFQTGSSREMMPIDAKTAAVNTDAFTNASVHADIDFHHARVAKLVLVDDERSHRVPMCVQLTIHQGHFLVFAQHHVASKNSVPSR